MRFSIVCWPPIWKLPKWQKQMQQHHFSAPPILTPKYPLHWCRDNYSRTKINFTYLYMLDLSFLHQFLFTFWCIIFVYEGLYYSYVKSFHIVTLLTSYLFMLSLTQSTANWIQLYCLQAQLVLCSEACHYMAVCSQLRVLFTIDLRVLTTCIHMEVQEWCHDSESPKNTQNTVTYLSLIVVTFILLTLYQN